MRVSDGAAVNDNLKEKLRERMKRWRAPFSGFPEFARDCLKIQNKEGRIVPFIMNDAQWALHNAVEDQLARTGMVRMTGLKARRQGFSTYVAGRYYWKVCTTFGRKVYILSHEKKSSEALFAMVDRFQRYNPFAPEVGEDNAAKLTFPGLESSYTVATAGAQEGGRGDDVNLFHGSEAAYWKNPDAHFAASLQTVALLPGTEIILESTSAGPVGRFYEQFQKGLLDSEVYESIFIPWFVSREYIFPASEDFKLDDVPPKADAMSEKEVAEAFKLSPEQVSWRRQKISELTYDRFLREYPATADDAWAANEEGRLIKSVAVMRARKRETEPSGPLIIGVDPASSGGDRFAVAFREGNKITNLIWRNKINTIEATEWLLELILKHRPERVQIDSGNIGQAVITNLRSRDEYCVKVIRAVAFGAPSQIKQANKGNVGPINRRAEMWGRMRDWLESETSCADIPDLNELGSDLLAPDVKWRDNGDWLLQSKQDMKAEGKRSPDLGDALALTFASREILAPRERAKTSIHEVDFGRVVEDIPPETEDRYYGETSWMA